MKASNITNIVSKLIKERLPVFIWGAPGIGKSSIVKAIAKDMNLEFIDLRLALLDPTDLKGIPFFDSKTNQGVWAKPSFLPDSSSQSKGILFLDEINSAPPAVQASAYQLVLDRKVGEYTLPDGWSIVSAGNRESDRGVVYRMPPPLANRFVHFEMEVDFDDWKNWAYQNNIDSSIISFLQYDNSMLFNFDASSNQKSFATPRSWEFANTIVKQDIDKNLLLETLSGAVGEDGAVGYLSFRKVMNNLPNINKILDGTIKEIENSNDIEVMVALSIGIVNAIKLSNNPNHIDNILEFSLNIPNEFAIMLIKDLQLNSINIESSKIWSRWVDKFAYLLV